MEQFAAATMVRGATVKLHETIKEYNEISSRQTEQMLRLTDRILTLTKLLAVLTSVMTIGVAVQIYLALSGS